jgi:NADH-quinone oxidoreductase subunit F
VLTTIQYFRPEYEAHINQKMCPAKSCRELIEYHVIPDSCTGCTLCARVCPVDAISGAKKELHFIDSQTCTHCGACYDACKFEAIEILTGTSEEESTSIQRQDVS